MVAVNLLAMHNTPFVAYEVPLLYDFAMDIVHSSPQPGRYSR